MSNRWKVYECDACGKDVPCQIRFDADFIFALAGVCLLFPSNKKHYNVYGDRIKRNPEWRYLCSLEHKHITHPNKQKKLPDDRFSTLEVV